MKKSYRKYMIYVLGITFVVLLTVCTTLFFDSHINVVNGHVVSSHNGEIALNVAVSVFLILITLAVVRQHYRQASLEIFSSVDSLTHLYNRRAFDERVDHYIANKMHRGRPALVVMVDIDDFKLVNDLYGHEVGDGVLRDLAANMKACFGPDAILCRNGGDEFCALIPGDNPIGLTKLANMTKYYGDRGKKYPYTVSIGYAVYPHQGYTYQMALSHADMALYNVKLNSKDSFAKYQPNMGTEQRSKLGFSLDDISNNLPGAILIYRADGDHEILFANAEMITMMGCTSFDELMNYTGRTFDGVVYEADRERVNREIDQQIERGSYDYVDYRIKTMDGRIKEVFDNGKLVDEDRFGRVFYVVILDISQHKTRHLLETALERTE